MKMKLKKGKALDKMAKDNASKQRKTKNKKKIAEITTDDFFNQDFENMELSGDEEENVEKEVPAKKTKKMSVNKKDGKTTPNTSKQTPEKAKKKNKVVKEKEKTKNENKKKTDDSKDDSESGEDDLDEVQHKKALQNLQDTDPEFFNYLKTHDTKLLDFNVDDDDDDVGVEDGDDLRHIPDDNLSIASDDSDYEAEGGKKTDVVGGPVKVTFKLIKTWQEEIQEEKSTKTIRCVVEAFRAALETVSDSETQSTRYRVEGGTIFNSIVQLCMMSLPVAFKKFLHISDDGHDSKIEVHKSKRFPKIKGLLKSYLSDLVKLLQHVSSSDIVTVLLKHLHQMLFYTKSFSSLRKPLLRVLLKFWSTGEEDVRVGAFVCILRIATTQSAVLNGLQKTMYIKYVENAKFVSPTTLPGINFMRRSLVSLYLIDSEYSYQNAFLYVRQLAIHLRNALTLKKKEHFQTVYNWQYVNSLGFWSNLIAESKPTSMLRELLYPLVQVTIGVIKLIPTFQYYPLRFHCVKMLMNISKETGKHIPSLPLIYEILEKYDFSKRHKIISMKPISLICMLRVSKSQARENGYKDAILENVYELILESAAKDSHLIYFPDMYVTCRVALKNFLKNCHVANYCRKIKQLLEKIEESCKFLEDERAKRTFDLANLKDVEVWETQIKNKGTPVSTFYESWLKVHQIQQMKLLTQNEQIAEAFKVPAMKKSKKASRPRDSDEDSDLEIPVEEMERRLQKDKEKKDKKKKKAKKAKTADDDDDLPMDGDDVVQDIGDWN